MPEASEHRPSTPTAWLQRGQASEAAGRLDLAIADYDQAIASLRGEPPDSLDLEQRRLLGVAWMNRGNALQRTATPGQLAEAVSAYDEAIAAFKTLPTDAGPRLRNHLGAAWLNRGHAQLILGDADAKASFQQAVSELATLPLDSDPSFRLNLAGAWTNLAHALLASTDPATRESSRDAARSCLRVLVNVDREHAMFAAMSLRARRAFVMATADLLATTERQGDAIAELASEATDAIEDGLAIARAFEDRGDTQLRPLAERLFRLGSQLYARHQPQFLGEFIVETLATRGLATDLNFLAIAVDAVAGALDRIQNAPVFVASNREAENLLATARSLRAAQDHLSTLNGQFSPASTIT
jgi:tetratricopeptide (TPR) repeat protein